MADYSWFRQPVPEGLKVRQVYGIAFSNDERAILRIEELNIELDNIHYLGYFLVQENNEEYAQVRMIAKIKSINENCPDPATGKTYGRELVEIDKIKDFLNYPDKAGNTMIDDAIRMANLYLLT